MIGNSHFPPFWGLGGQRFIEDLFSVVTVIFGLCSKNQISVVTWQKLWFKQPQIGLCHDINQFEAA